MTHKLITIRTQTRQNGVGKDTILVALEASLTSKPIFRGKYLLELIVLVAFLPRVLISPFIDVLMSPEHIHCWEQGNVAASLVSGHGFGNPFDAHPQPSAVMPPIYPLLVAACFKIFGAFTPSSVYAVHVLNCLFSALACIPIFFVARHSFGERVAWWAAWGWAFSPYGIYFSATWPWSTHLLLLCLCTLLLLSQKMESSARLGVWVVFALLAGFAALTEPMILLIVLVLMLCACWKLAQAKQKWVLPTMVACLTIATSISPWMIRNAIVFHRFIPMRDGMGMELWMGNNGQELRWTSDDLHPLHNLKEQADYDRGELTYMEKKGDEAKSYIHDHPRWYAKMCLRRMVYLWTGFWSVTPEYLALEPMDMANIPYTTCLNLLAVIGLFRLWRRKAFEAVRYAGVLFVFPAMYYFTHPEIYHMRPLDPIILLLCCYAVASWIQCKQPDVRSVPSES
jgi:4-amino-4-deoxy-L-arabinose transferase-like glycosyltransferase